MAGQLGTSSAIINGQLVPQARSFLMYPTAVGPNVQGVPASPPQSSGAYGSGGGGMGGDDQGSKAAANPWSPVDSPVPWMLGMFITGYVLLRYVHWGY